MLVCLFIMVFMGTLSLSAKGTDLKVETIKCNTKCSSSFAIFIDSKSFMQCKEEVLAYKNILESEGLGAYIVSADWETPEQVKAQITKLSAKKTALEGMVFIGDIPIVRVRKGQYLTTAFKMNEKTFPMTESSVTSDRFYDCPNLSFEYIGKDGENDNWFYYNLLSDGSQMLSPAFYSARIYVPQDLVKATGKSEHILLKDFLAKIVEAHKEANALDRFIHFAGHGYNSDCLTAWRQQSIAFKNYFPEAFKATSGNKFYNFRQDQQMKFHLFTQMQRPGTDLFMFYEHGAPQTQYINGDFAAGGTLAENADALKYVLRRQYARIKPDKKEDFVNKVCEHFELDREVLSAEEIAKHKVADSAIAANRNIHLKDLVGLKPSPRVTIFNACYNGSFHKSGYVAGYHLFNGGKTVVTQANSVNVLQDKWAEQLIGILSLGARVGFWQNEVVTLESHLFGDPTYRFTLPYSFNSSKIKDFNVADINSVLLNKKGDKEFWSLVLESNKPSARGEASAYSPIVRALAIKALQKIYLLDRTDTEFAGKMFTLMKKDPSMIVRAQALLALSFTDNDSFVSAIKIGLNDPYELIRRLSAHWAGKVGSKEFLPFLQDNIENHPEIERVRYASYSALKCINSNTEQKFDLSGKKGVSQLRNTRNYPAHWSLDILLPALKDTSYGVELRVVMAEALGWYCYSVNRDQILDFIKELFVSEQDMDATLKEELSKTVKRLEFR